MTVSCSFCGDNRKYGAARDAEAWVLAITARPALICGPCVGLGAALLADGRREDVDVASGCTFCGATRSERFVAGREGVHICADCIRQAAGAIARSPHAADLGAEIASLTKALEDLEAEISSHDS